MWASGHQKPYRVIRPYGFWLANKAMTIAEDLESRKLKRVFAEEPQNHRSPHAMSKLNSLVTCYYKFNHNH